MKGSNKKKQSPLTQEKNVARVFFSSPFGGLEEERELLTKQYWPELAHLCQRSGYEFVPVDMRWGITSELSTEAATISICLRELDRSDMIVGFFGQRYGWHGSQDEFLQKTFDHAIPRYPWLENYRDRSVTELEFLHGHLNNQGARPACFFFRDKGYDDKKLAECIAEGDERGQRKYRATSDGPRAAEYLNDLKLRVKQTEDECLMVVMSYPTPEEGARLMFETVRDHLTNLLASTPQEDIGEMEKEHTQHETFLVTRRGMGGEMVGGDDYLRVIDMHVASSSSSLSKREQGGVYGQLLLVGDAGSGKSCILANWIEEHTKQSPDNIVAMHFVGCTSGSTRELDTLKHLCYQIEEELKERNGEHDPQDEKMEEAETEDVKAARKSLLRLVNDAAARDVKVVIVIDGLNKIHSGGKAMKELYWLPKIASSNVRIILSTSKTDAKNIAELTEQRGFTTLNVQQLTSNLRSKVTEGMLRVRGKELSPRQMEKVIGNGETGNPLYLFILLQELCGFGSFFELDEYIDSLLKSKSTVDLFVKFLERLEQDYDVEGKQLVRKVMCCLLLSHRGLSETELKSLATPSNKEWSALYFAMDVFLIESEGLYRFGYTELAEAVEIHFCPTEESKDPYCQLLIDHFQSAFQDLDQRFNTQVPQRIVDELPWQLEKARRVTELVDCLSAMNMFSALSKGQAKYDMMTYWTATGLSGEEIVDRLLLAIDDQVALLYLEKEERGGGDGGQKTPAQELIPLLVDVSDFLDDAGYSASLEPLLLRAIRMQKSQYTMEDMERNDLALQSYCELRTKLACNYASAERFDEADEIHKETLGLREKHEKRFKEGKSYIAVILNNLGFIHHSQHHFKEAEEYYKRALELHREVHGSNHDLVASTLNNLGIVIYSQARYPEAAEMLKESLEIYEDVYFGELPPDIGGTYLNFAMCSARLADKGLEDVEPLYKRALEIRINAVGKNHPSVAQTYTSYGSYLLRVNQTERALEMSKDALNISEIANGPEHQSTLLILENIALAYVTLQKHDDAHVYYDRAGEVLCKQGRMNLSHPKLNSVMASYYLGNSREDDAQRALARIVTTSFATARDFAALDYLDGKVAERPVRPHEHSVDFAIEKFPSDQMLLNRKLIHLAPQGGADEMLTLLERGGFGAETYNNCYSEFVSNGHREAGLKIMEKAAEKFPEELIILENLAKCYAFYKRNEDSARVLKQALRVDPENLDLLVLRVRVLALGNQLQDSKALIQTGLPIARKKDAAEIIAQLENFLGIINKTLGGQEKS